jgi:hypothetical protein
VKRVLICIGWAIAASRGIQASTVISCNPNPSATSNACGASYLNTFATLQWNSLSATNSSDPVNFYNGLNYNTTSAPWDTSLAGVNIAVTGTEARTAVNYADIPETFGGTTYWVNSANVANSPYAFTGQFNSQPNAGAGSPGDYLVGSAGSAPLIISANQALAMFGFRISTASLTSFQVTIDLFTGPSGTGTPAEVLTLSLGGGGSCAGLIASTPTTAPVPCNNAPFVTINPSAQYRSFSVTTNDPDGFYLDSFALDVPEPGAMLLSGIGLLSLAYAIRRKRTSPAGRP